MTMTHKMAAVAASAALVAGTVAGCGSSASTAGGTTSPTGTNASSSSPSAGVSPSTAPSSSAPSSSVSSSTPLPPLSPFEGTGQVAGLRAYAREYAKAVNAGKMSYAPLLATLGPTGKSQKSLTWMFGTDLKKKLRYPGPLPFTPTSVAGNKVFACVWASGFATDRKTGRPPEAKRIEPLQFWFVKDSKGKYLVNGIYSASGLTCAQHKVIGRAW